MIRPRFAPLALGLLASSGLGGCSDASDSSTDPVEIQALGLSLLPEAAGDEAVAVAEQLWEEISGMSDYTSWPLLAGTTERQPSDAPHGDFATVHYSGQDADNPSPGDILVKELWVGEESEPQALTVMLKLEGFDPENSNWFYAKYLLDGTLETTPTGVPLAGAMEPAPGAACRGCHRAAPGNDFQWL